MWPADREVYTVSEITAEIREHIEGAFDRVSVSGEVSNFKRHSSGHLYFTLKDEGAQLSAVCWRSTAGRLRVDVKNGMRAVVTGRLTVYEAYGRYQIIADVIEDVGEGARQRAFFELKTRLEAEGLFDVAHKKPLPRFPERVAVVTSPTGAALRDVVSTLRRRWPCVEVLVAPVHVQGEHAAPEITDAIDTLSRARGVDVIIVGRGGGSLEDLWAFNEETVARAIFRCALPLVSAVGHETDFTIADFVADARAATPTMAAEIVAPDGREIRAGLDAAVRRASRAVVTGLEVGGRRLREQLRSYALGRIRGRIERAMQSLDHSIDRAALGAMSRVRSFDGRLAAVASRLEALDPRAVLARGYAACTDARTGAAVAGVEEAVEAGRLRVTFKDGGVVAGVEERVP